MHRCIGDLGAYGFEVRPGPLRKEVAVQSASNGSGQRGLARRLGSEEGDPLGQQSGEGVDHVLEMAERIFSDARRIATEHGALEVVRNEACPAVACKLDAVGLGRDEVVAVGQPPIPQDPSPHDPEGGVATVPWYLLDPFGVVEDLDTATQLEVDGVFDRAYPFCAPGFAGLGAYQHVHGAARVQAGREADQVEVPLGRGQRCQKNPCSRHHIVRFQLQ
ncbi:MAG: hypothetical protein V9E94_13025 [Microthrixaceae bacterium]